MQLLSRVRGREPEADPVERYTATGSGTGTIHSCRYEGAVVCLCCGVEVDSWEDALWMVRRLAQFVWRGVDATV